MQHKKVNHSPLDVHGVTCLEFNGNQKMVNKEQFNCYFLMHISVVTFKCAHYHESTVYIWLRSIFGLGESTPTLVL